MWWSWALGHGLLASPTWQGGLLAHRQAPDAFSVSEGPALSTMASTKPIPHSHRAYERHFFRLYRRICRFTRDASNARLAIELPCLHPCPSHESRCALVHEPGSRRRTVNVTVEGQSTTSNRTAAALEAAMRRSNGICLRHSGSSTPALSMLKSASNSMPAMIRQANHVHANAFRTTPR